jgi:hypothetical protein
MNAMNGLQEGLLRIKHEEAFLLLLLLRDNYEIATKVQANCDQPATIHLYNSATLQVCKGLVF